jgi:hypothetical protein
MRLEPIPSALLNEAVEILEGKEGCNLPWERVQKFPKAGLSPDYGGPLRVDLQMVPAGISQIFEIGACGAASAAALDQRRGDDGRLWNRSPRPPES